ncbi:MAG: NAD(P)H-hydrate dehydratase [Chthoniobacteraceae bacterium]|nr:NAD(P)H-hydrate dehydratase [Chthoniobacteraceae bacterium]
MNVTCEEMRAMERRAFDAGASAETLMEEAGARMARAVRQFFPQPGVCRVFYGKGHNGGDALVAARHLARAGWRVALETIFLPDTLAPLTRRQLDALGSRGPEPAVWEEGPRIVLDGLLGIGAQRGLHGAIRDAAAAINRLRHDEGTAVFALDIPTGLDGDTGEADPGAVRADFTLCVGFAKRGLLADAALDFVGRLAVLPLAALSAQAPDAGPEGVATPQSLAGLLPPRPFGTHKGQCGRVGIVAGSRGMTGAAIMAANAAVRAGAGLVSLFVTPEIYAPVAAAALPEVMVTPVDCYLAVLERPLDALAIGPGLGREDGPDVLAVCEDFKGPLVIDADALNLLAGSPQTLRHAAGPRLLTPHPGEMLRLFPESARLTRRETVERFLGTQGEGALTLLLKGSRTLVAERSSGGAAARLSWNTTGAPGMATGGMGDVLTGVSAALAGQGLAFFDAARVGAWVCGRAAERALSHGGQSQESLAATDLLGTLGAAFRDLRDPGAC